MSKAKSEAAIGRLSQTTKLQVPSFNLSPRFCRRGSVLRNYPNTVCSHCYAREGHYLGLPSTTASDRRLLQLHKREDWVASFVRVLEERDIQRFRWFDAGDVQGEEHLHKILDICTFTPGCRHWMSTREIGAVQQVLSERSAPDNLNIRISADFINDAARESPVAGCTLAIVSTEPVASVWNCPATFSEEHTCRAHNCRACWNKNVAIVAYKLH